MNTSYYDNRKNHYAVAYNNYRIYLSLFFIAIMYIYNTDMVLCQDFASITSQKEFANEMFKDKASFIEGLNEICKKLNPTEKKHLLLELYTILYPRKYNDTSVIPVILSSLTVFGCFSSLFLFAYDSATCVSAFFIYAYGLILSTAVQIMYGGAYVNYTNEITSGIIFYFDNIETRIVLIETIMRYFKAQ